MTNCDGRVLPALIALSAPCMGSGKTTVAEELEVNYGFEIVRFADTLKSMTKALFMAAGLTPDVAAQLIADPELKEQRLPLFGNKSPRHIMQTLGGDWGRGLISETLWVDLTMATVRQLREQGFPVVIDDMRYPNEADAVRAAGGRVVHVVRPEATITVAHASEGALNDYPHDYVLQNDGGFDGVPDRVRQLMLALPDLN